MPEHCSGAVPDSIVLGFQPLLRLRFRGCSQPAMTDLADEYVRHLDSGDAEPAVDVIELEKISPASADSVTTRGPRGTTLAFRLESDGGRFRIEVGPIGRARPLTAHGAIRHAIEPALYAAMPSRGAAFVHGGAVSIGGRAVAVFGSRGSGKTAAVLDLIGAGREADSERAAFLAGDKFILAGNGAVVPYVRRQHLSAYTMGLFPGMRDRVLASGGGGLCGRAGARLALWRKGELRCRIEDAVPGAAVGGPAKLAAAAWLERRRGIASVSIAEIPSADLARLAAADARSEFSRALPLASHPAFGTPTGGIEAIIREALSGVRCFRLIVPDRVPPRDAGDAIRSLL
jgi:hypothetical protein